MLQRVEHYITHSANKTKQTNKLVRKQILMSHSTDVDFGD